MTRNSHSKLPVAVLLGATASGKTSTLTSILDKNIQIINSDSLQVYKGLSIGTAKPTEAELSRVKHHLVDFLDPRDEFSVGDFVQAADSLIPEIIEADHIPLISGGTAFYIRTFLFGVPQTPKADEATRARVEKMLADEGLAALYARLQEIDPEAAENININDVYRVCRALEVYYSSGKKLSSFKQPDSLRPHLDPIIIGIQRERAELYDRINSRVEQMFEQGLLSEIKTLLANGYNPTDPALKAIGYSEFFDQQGRLREDLDEVKRLIQKNSRRYAKRQLTFFKRIPGVLWVEHDRPEEIVSLIAHHFSIYGIALK
ncbi:MAG: tRNA (adenosine(37)-N6)-dimethylallyltransferase MiaA [Spirochaetales bacterium]|nr:tRNA (adenosine(37)-N6)-dimethylallyltransferase MiaA [Spirochaetales bacterium]